MPLHVMIVVMIGAVVMHMIRLRAKQMIAERMLQVCAWGLSDLFICNPSAATFKFRLRGLTTPTPALPSRGRDFHVAH